MMGVMDFKPLSSPTLEGYQKYLIIVFWNRGRPYTNRYVFPTYSGVFLSNVFIYKALTLYLRCLRLIVGSLSMYLSSRPLALASAAVK